MRKEKRNLAITEIFMILIAVIWFIPIYYLIVTTLKSSQEATANPLGLPKVLRLDNYVNAWVNMEFPRAFGNTLFITATAVLLIVIFGSMAGYALARTKSKMGTRVFLLFLAGLIVPFQMNIVSLYKIVKGFGLMNTLWSVILVDVAINTPQAVFLFKEFIESTIPKEFFGYRPRNILSTTLLSRHWFNSWCTIATPFSSASFGPEKFTSLPSNIIVPSSF
jgi:raffinose/stachyose/melibiose transport system permease protein